MGHASAHGKAHRVHALLVDAEDLFHVVHDGARKGGIVSCGAAALHVPSLHAARALQAVRVGCDRALLVGIALVGRGAFLAGGGSANGVEVHNQWNAFSSLVAGGDVQDVGTANAASCDGAGVVLATGKRVGGASAGHGTGVRHSHGDSRLGGGGHLERSVVRASLVEEKHRIVGGNSLGARRYEVRSHFDALGSRGHSLCKFTLGMADAQIGCSVTQAGRKVGTSNSIGGYNCRAPECSPGAIDQGKPQGSVHGRAPSSWFPPTTRIFHPEAARGSNCTGIALIEKAPEASVVADIPVESFTVTETPERAVPDGLRTVPEAPQPKAWHAAPAKRREKTGSRRLLPMETLVLCIGISF